MTALALLAVILPALLTEMRWAWPMVSFVFVLLAAWEWLRMLEPARANFAALLALALFGLGVILALGREPARIAGGDPFWSALVLAGCALGCLFWGVVAPWQLRTLGNNFVPAWTAVLVLAAAWLAVVQLQLRGMWELLSGLAVVWVADVAAYFVGRRFGRKKLAPRISPGKTQEGAFGAGFAVVSLSLAAAMLAPPHWPAVLPMRWLAELSATVTSGLALLIWIAILLVLVGLSILGDLYESMIKREAGVKDSSGLLPGHGGVLDRIDALLPVLPALVLVDSWFRWLGISQ
jgi:phosphatidate cytidylyltransferase